MQLRAVHCGTATAAQLSLDPGTRSGPNMNGGVHESSTTCRLHSLSGCEGAVRASSPLPPRVAGRLHQLSDPAGRPLHTDTPPAMAKGSGYRCR